MQSHRQNSSPDIRVLRSPTQDGLFGVKVQVQGIKGQPFVILNSPDQETNRDVSVITHQAGYNPGVTTRRTGEGRLSPNRNTETHAFNFHIHPEILRPYNPDSHDNSTLLPSQVAKRAGLNGSAPKPRIPLPAEAHEAPPISGPKPPRSPNSVDSDPFMSVGKLISQFNSSQQQRGRRGPRSRLDLDQCRRSRSVDSGRASDSSSSSSSSRASSLRAVRGETPGTAAVYPPGSARARLLSGEVTGIRKREDVKPSGLKENRGRESVMSPQAVRPAQRTVSFRTDNESTVESGEREAQVTPDLLKGQQELTVDPTEDSAKQVLFAYLQEGTTDDDSTTEMKVELLLERINRLKWRTAENVEEEERNFEAEVKVLQGRQASLQNEVFELKNRLQVELEVKLRVVIHETKFVTAV